MMLVYIQLCVAHYTYKAVSMHVWVVLHHTACTCHGHVRALGFVNMHSEAEIVAGADVLRMAHRPLLYATYCLTPVRTLGGAELAVFQ